MKHNILITILVILTLTVIGLVAYITLLPQPAAAPVVTRGVQKVASTDSVSQDVRDISGEESNFAQYEQYDRQIDLFHLDDEKKVLVDETPKEHSVECEKKIDEHDQSEYSVVDGCLYKNGIRAMKYSLYLYGHTDFYGNNDVIKANVLSHNRLGTSNLKEWFRFEHDGKLYIFLEGGAGCGGCFFNGRYLQIDQKTDVVEGKFFKLPFMRDLILSPDKKQAIHSVMNDNDGADLYLYDFIALKDTRKLYTVPQGKILYAWGDGPWLFEDAIIWNDGDVYVQLYEKIGDTGEMNDYIKSDNPIKIDLN